MIIGGDAAGMSAATQVPRQGTRHRGRRARGTSAVHQLLGVRHPVRVGGVIAGGVDALVAESSDEHSRPASTSPRPRGNGHRPRRRPGRVPRPARRQRQPHRLRSVDAGHRWRTDAPRAPGIDLPFIHGVQSLDDAQALLAFAVGRVPPRSSSSAAATSIWRWPRRTSTQVHGDGRAEGAAAARRGRRRLRPRVAEAVRSRHRRPLRRRGRRASSRDRCRHRTDRSRPSSSSSASASRLARELAEHVGMEPAPATRSESTTAKRPPPPRVGRGRLRRVRPPRDRRARAHRARHLANNPAGSRASTWRAGTPAPAPGPRHRHHQALHAGGRANRGSTSSKGARGRASTPSRRQHRHHDDRRLPTPRPRGDRADRRPSVAPDGSSVGRSSASRGRRSASTRSPRRSPPR